MEEILAISILFVAFLATMFLTKKWIEIARKFGLVGKDMNKYKKSLIPEAGGVVVTLVISFCLLIYIFAKTFYLRTVTHLIDVFAIITTLLLAGFLGFIDDIIGWKKGLTQLQKPLLTIPIAIPLMVINAGNSVMNIPFFGPIDFGILYPLLIVPIGIIGAANGFNMLAGYNGLEAGMGAVIFITLGIVSFYSTHYWLALLCFVVVATLFTFLIFNWFPSKVFPGNSFTYSIGALVATVAILGNMEKIAVWLFIPYIVEFILFLRAKKDKVRSVEAFGKPNKDDSLELPYKKVYDCTHFAIWFLKKIKKKVYEQDVTLFLITIETLLAIIGLSWLI